MKKFKFIFFTFICSIVFLINTNASTFKAKINFNQSNDYVNLFYEFQNNTPLSQFLLENGTDLSDVLCTYSGNNNCSADVIGIFKPDVIPSYEVPEGTEYLFHINSSFVSSRTNIDYEKISLGFSSRSGLSIFLCFDSDFNYLGKYTSYNDFNYEYSFIDNDITSLFSALYYVKNSISLENLSYDKYVLNKIIVGNEVYTLEDNDNFNSFTSWFRDIFTTAFIDEDYGFNFDEFRKRPIIGKQWDYLSLYKIMFGKNTLNVPDGWEKVNISDYEYGFYFIPKVSDISSVCPTMTSCSDVSFMIYKTNTIQNIMLGALNYSTGTAIYENNYTFYQNTVSPYKLFSIYDGALVSDEYLIQSQYPSYIYQIYTDFPTFDAFVYYNPNYYDVGSANVTTSAEFDVLGNSVTISSSELTARQIKQGAANNINYNGDISELGEYIKKEGLTFDSVTNELVSNPYGSDILSMAKDAISNMKSFAGSFLAVGSMSREILDSLPSEITSVLWFAFITGILVIIIKIIL